MTHRAHPHTKLHRSSDIRSGSGCKSQTQPGRFGVDKTPEGEKSGKEALLNEVREMMSASNVLT